MVLTPMLHQSAARSFALLTQEAQVLGGQPNVIPHYSWKFPHTIPEKTDEAPIVGE
jgi:hypothetical protein